MTVKAPDPVSTIVVNGKTLTPRYVETQQVKDGVECDVYQFADDDSRDLAVVRVSSGFSTPLQLVCHGDETIEMFVSGEGKLSVWSADGNKQEFDFQDGDVHSGKLVSVGEKMQWVATGAQELVFYELCTPPYEDGRFKDLV